VYQPPGGGQPPYGTPPPFYPQQPPPSKANGPLIAAIGCGARVIIGALVTVLVILVSNKNDNDGPSVSPLANPSASVSEPPSESASPSASLPSYTRPDCQFGTDDTFLTECGGTWEGDYIQTKPSVVKYYGKLTVTSDAKTASVSFSGNGLDCSGTVTILSNTGGYKALVRTDIVSGRSTGVCASVTYGTITPSAISGPEKLILQLYSSRTAAENNSPPSNSVGGLLKN
jgi:hypothetical protein